MTTRDDAATPNGYVLRLSIAALGVVYGDIGTSPLYAVRECFGEHGLREVSRGNVLGVLSLMFWSLVLIVSVKYLALVMRADNEGEGGILALLSLVQKRPRPRWLQLAIVAMGVFGAALLYGDGVITPAISVLSALEGIAVRSPVFEPWILPMGVAILAALFAIQRHGTARVGQIFGPITFAWFVALAALGVRGILMEPSVLAALSPHHAVSFFLANGWDAFLVLGAVFLVVTGSEALYADMGHFGMKPIRVTWFAVVLPSLLLNYLGQGALLLADKNAVANPFYHLAPSWALVPLIVLATVAACIASQAVISGAFSLTRQAIQLGFCPRMEIVHTSAREIGQIYVPVVNWGLFLAVVALVLGFGSSTRLAAAYGIAVSSTMVITASLAFFVATDHWKWRRGLAVFVFGSFLVVDSAFLGSNAVKFLHGGWFPLLLAIAIFALLTTWKRGRSMLAERLREGTLAIPTFLESLERHPVARVPGTAVFMTGNPEGMPLALLHNLKHNKVLHERVILLTIETREVPHVSGRERVHRETLDHGFHRVIARYGFMETPNVPDLLGRLHEHGLSLELMETSFFLGRETLLATRQRGMSRWRKSLFGWMSRNARPATAYFDLPPNRVVELGAQVEL